MHLACPVRIVLHHFLENCAGDRVKSARDGQTCTRPRHDVRLQVFCQAIEVPGQKIARPDCVEQSVAIGHRLLYIIAINSDERSVRRHGPRGFDP